MTIKQAILKGATSLKSENVSSPKLKARLLLQYVLKKPRKYLVIYDSQRLDKQKEIEYFKYIQLLNQGEPIEHITHHKEFMKLDFFVNENVLIPRQDTEVLVEEVIRIAKNTGTKKILDLCTGSGVIAVSLAKYLDDVEITATDVSKKALDVAKSNAKKNKVEDKITFVESNLFQNLSMKKYDLIVSNPPYIKRKEIRKLDKEVQKEPKIALDGGEDGLYFYKKILGEGYDYLVNNGFLCLEIGFDQKEDVFNIIRKEDKYLNAYCLKDLCDNDRVIVAKVGV